MQGGKVAHARNDHRRKCRYCDRKFSKEEHLRRHERSHTGEKPFKCPKCYKRYGRSDVLVRHLQTHSGEPRRDTGPQIPSPDHISMDTTGHNEPAVRRGSQSLQCVDIQPDVRFLLPPSREHTFIQPSTVNDAVSQLSQTDNNVFANPTNEPEAISNPTHEQGPSLRHTSSGLHTPPHVGSAIFDAFSYDFASNQIREISSVSGQAAGVGPGHDSRHNIELEEGTRSDGIELFDRVTSPFLFFHQASHSSEQAPSFPMGPQDGRALHETDHALFADLNSFGSDPFPTEAEFDTYAYFGPTVLDGLDFDIPHQPIQVSAQDYEKRLTFLPVEQTHEIRRLWRGRRSGPGVRLIWSLWFKVARHGADNIFSKPPSPVPGLHRSDSKSDNDTISRWGMDDACRNELIHFCKSLDDTREEHSPDRPPQSLAADVQSDSGSEKSVPGFSATGFPTTEVFDASLDFFFQYSPLQFIHRATFNAKTTPPSLLLPMCLIGLASIYPDRSKTFILRYQKKLMRYCRNDLTSKSLEYGDSWELLITIVSAFLVNYLALGLTPQIEESQVFTFSGQLLHMVQSHGLFSVFLGDDLAPQLKPLPNFDESSWKVWARVESVKRLVCYLVLLDAACSRVMGSSGVLDCSRVELYLPCEESLFDASTFARFAKITEKGADLIPGRFRLRDFHSRAPLDPNTLAMQTVMSCFCLQVVAARHALPVGGRSIFESASCTLAEAFDSDPENKSMMLAVIALPSTYAETFKHMEPVSLLAWNNLCLLLTADLDLLEIGCGREGSESARRAMVAIGKWARSASARRAILHATQIFSILSSTRLSESNFIRADRLLFMSALVLSMYLFVVEHKEDDDESPVFELVQDIDWTAVGAPGLQYSSETGQSNEEQPACPSSAVIQFIKHGGPVAFSKEERHEGSIAARKVLLSYVYLLDSVGKKWRDSMYSQRLRIMSDLMIESRS
ncbi:hypothetical protein T440DRAFT_55602 [Plenodomus tracheiphilus IPT5]|uniref:C2H2-type domain-containing protein n=1 Tax=Plenodomus tracheiphilus IPT5 TaxID=1408161 RepID=A0A6A7B8I9_9PLEO|nr:hypothetical protein T440DRAFT_55602 [Plenodomus tracheiphilus IPT5]